MAYLIAYNRYMIRNMVYALLTGNLEQLYEGLLFICSFIYWPTGKPLLYKTVSFLMY